MAISGFRGPRSDAACCTPEQMILEQASSEQKNLFPPFSLQRASAAGPLCQIACTCSRLATSQDECSLAVVAVVEFRPNSELSLLACIVPMVHSTQAGHRSCSPKALSKTNFARLLRGALSLSAQLQEARWHEVRSREAPFCSADKDLHRYGTIRLDKNRCRFLGEPIPIAVDQHRHGQSMGGRSTERCFLDSNPGRSTEWE